ncbi:hypothetical protein [Geobacter sp. SVR]|uniref:hypothetical protein n=1 Tax=Geobacter sp. SVR TaxID=2495594 RepID=UPI00143EF94C|nr:hypothetical protein [Geobacter sp. SVR]BCS55026.1 hypothetical protein GSVR_33340 [Geobacter sp. SVR]GCF85207.1 hypothetical protein GSbR_18070 [Geobacter sp. SVR]
MKKFLKMFGFVGLLAGMLMVAGCGDDAAKAPTGKVVKGPVNGATVSFANSALTATTDANGNYTILVPGAAVTSTGGTYFDLATNTSKTAPTLTAAAGATAITPITTVLNQLSGQAKIDFTAALTKLGITNPLTDSLATVTSSNRVAITLNEILGDAIASGASNTDVNTFAANIATSVNTTVPASESALATAASGAAAGTSISTTSFNTIADAVNELPNNGTLPTGSTGGTGGTGGTGPNF